MSFPSIQFIVFLVLVFCAYHLRPSRQWQNAVCVLSSYYFYGWWDIRFCSLLFLSSIIDYWIGGQIDRTPHPLARKRWLILSITANLGLLGYFKYSNFFIESFALALAEMGLRFNYSTLNIILPVGISFYTFQTMSYTIDIYRGHFRPKPDFVAYLSFVSFFPQLVAGPIERAANLLPQFHQARLFSLRQAVSGCQLMLWGYFKKIAVADNLAQVVDPAYAFADTVSASHLALATFCFAFQIYFDFSAYSDIATGVARLFAIELRRNFAFPYFSRNLSEFWARWHISLSSWFRDYVFIPLGGSRGRPFHRLRNILVTFFLSGLWHGAGATFVLWGFVHGLFLAPRHLRRATPPPLGSVSCFVTAGQILKTFSLVCLAWILFRADSLDNALVIYRKIFTAILTPEFYIGLWPVLQQWPMAFIALSIALVVEAICYPFWNPLAALRVPRIVRWGIYTLVFWAIFYLGPSRIQPFIYFQF